jgi:O-antigen ligase
MHEKAKVMFWGTQEGRSLDALGLLAVLGVAVAFAVSSPGLAALTLLSVPIALYILGRPDLGLWLVVALTPVETFLNVDFLLTKAVKLALVALVTCGLWLASGQRSQGEMEKLKDPYRLPMCLLLLTGFVASLLASSPAKSAIGLASLLLFVSYYFMARDSRVLLPLGPRLLRTIILVAVPTAVLALLQLFQGYGGMLGSREQQAVEASGELATLWPSIQRASATLNSANAAGAFLAVASLILIVHSAVFRKHRGGFLFLFALCVLGVLATFSRGALLGLILGLTFALWGLGGFKIRRRTTLIISAVAVVIGVAFSFEEVRGYLRLGVDAVSTSATRVDAWRAAASIIRRNPFVGIGFYEFQSASQGIIGDVDTPLHPHNGFLKAIVEQGPIGGFAYLLFLFAFLKTTIRSMRRFSQNLENRWMFGSIGSIGVCLFTHELVDAGFTIGNSSIAILFVTLLSLQVCMLRGLTRETSGPLSVPSSGAT